MPPLDYQHAYRLAPRHAGSGSPLIAMQQRCLYLIDHSRCPNIPNKNVNRFAPAAWAIRCDPSRGLWGSRVVFALNGLFKEIIRAQDAEYIFLNIFERTKNNTQLNFYLKFVNPQQMCLICAMKCCWVAHIRSLAQILG